AWLSLRSLQWLGCLDRISIDGAVAGKVVALALAALDSLDLDNDRAASSRDRSLLQSVRAAAQRAAEKPFSRTGRESWGAERRDSGGGQLAPEHEDQRLCDWIRSDRSNSRVRHRPA